MTDSTAPPDKYPDYTGTFAEVYLAELDYVKKRRDKINISSDAVVKECERVREKLLEKEGETRDSVTQKVSLFKKIYDYFFKRTEEAPQFLDVKPSTNTGLVGLALSGGGVRSATFNLGLLQSLAKNKVLQYCDYLSTVSGGGYIGSCLSSLLATNVDASTTCQTFPLANERDGEKGCKECAEVSHLREKANYLNFGNGLFNWDTWYHIGTIFFGVMLINIVPLIIILLIPAILLLVNSSFPFFHYFNVLVDNNLLIGLVAALFIWGVIIRFSPLQSKKVIENIFFLLLIVITGLWMLFQESKIEDTDVLKFGILILVALWVIIRLFSNVVSWMLRKASDDDSKWHHRNHKKIALVSAGLVLLISIILIMPNKMYAFLVAVVMLVVGYFIAEQGKLQRLFAKQIMSFALIVLLVTSFLGGLSGLDKFNKSIEGYVNIALLSFLMEKDVEKTLTRLNKSEKHIEASQLEEWKSQLKQWQQQLGENAPPQWKNLDIDQLEKKENITKNFDELKKHLDQHYLWMLNGQLIMESTREKIRAGTLKFEQKFDQKEDCEELRSRDLSINWTEELKSNKLIKPDLICQLSKAQSKIGWLKFIIIMVVMGIPIVVLLLIGLFINLNYTSLHYFYCDRLSEAYLIRRKKGEKTVAKNQSLQLQKLHAGDNGPYHLINTTLNVPSNKARSAELFIFSKYYCGAEPTGYKCTEKYQNGETTLATAMAISGAAVSPVMGTIPTSTGEAILMTLLNFRLHLWMPNPKCKRLPLFTIWSSYLYKEMFRKGQKDDTLLNLSDGGHYENLGVYSLLKRRCRLIIASDATADPEYHMADIENLTKKAYEDLGVTIKIDTTDLLPDSQNYSKVHFVKGTIHYPEGEAGTLFYIKTTMTGTEPKNLLNYRRRVSSQFPDETTADQFFTAAQFDAYRQLGELIGEKFCSKKKDVCEIKAEIEQIFGKDTISLSS
jgi:hypothetical protein